MSGAGALPPSTLPIADAALRAGAAWLAPGGPEGDVAVSSRVRLARNIRGYRFLNRCDGPARRRLLQQSRDAIHAVLGARPAGATGVGPAAWIDVNALPELERKLLVERHLMSKEHAKGLSADSPKGLAVSIPDERLSIMVNEEDHLRVQSLAPGLALTACLDRARDADERLGAVLPWAFHERFGYLTACPTNVGCAARLSVMVHLPGLRLLGEIEKVRAAARDMCLAVRGYYGEGSDAAGDLYQVSNQTTLGRAEDRLIADLQAEIVPAIVRAERQARQRLLEGRRRVVEDIIFRALATLRSARLLPPEEAISQLSLLRLGVLTGVIADVDLAAVNQLMLLTQPAHLQRVLGRTMDQQERREARADYVRQRLG